jgi:hypothetical protein
MFVLVVRRKVVGRTKCCWTYCLWYERLLDKLFIGCKIVGRSASRMKGCRTNFLYDERLKDELFVKDEMLLEELLLG